METITLEQMYYIGEIIGVIAIITLLVYVGRQLQQNVLALQAGQTQATFQDRFRAFFECPDEYQRLRELFAGG